MTLYYLDSSAWVKRYYRETGTAWVENLFAQHQPVACASFGVIEVTATLARKQKGRLISLSQFEQKMRDLDQDWQHLVQLGLTDQVVTTARELAKKPGLARSRRRSPGVGFAVEGPVG
jgi:predicted nucleic acid-binding protein